MTLLELLNATTAFLVKKGVEQARLNSEMLIAAGLGLKRLDLYLQFERIMVPHELDLLRPIVKRRGEREPIQHILGTANFFGFDFACDCRALVPRPETEILVQSILQVSPAGAGTLWDVGTGSGVVAISFLKHKPNWRAICSDISLDAIQLALTNAKKLEVSDRVTLLQAHLLNAAQDESLDALVANLPYLPSAWLPGLPPEVKYDPTLALDGGKDGLRLVESLVESLPRTLKPGAGCALEIAPEQANGVEQMLVNAGLIDVATVRDLTGVHRIVIGRKADPPKPGHDHAAPPVAPPPPDETAPPAAPAAPPAPSEAPVSFP